MTKKELKVYLRIYFKIAESLVRRKDGTEIKIGAKTKFVKFKNWVYRLPEYLREIKDEEKNEQLQKLIKLRFEQGKTDRTILAQLPISESTYYRWKEKIVEKIYAMFIESGYVSRKEIMQEAIDE